MTIENLEQFYDEFKESVVIEETKLNSLNAEIDKLMYKNDKLINDAKI